MNNFTPEELLEYHYGEMTCEKAGLLKKTLEEDWVLREKLSVIQEAAARLDKSVYAPRPEVVNRILSYAAMQVSIPFAD